MRVAVPRALVGGLGSGPPQKFGQWSKFVGQLLSRGEPDTMAVDAMAVDAMAVDAMAVDAMAAISQKVDTMAAVSYHIINTYL